MSTHQSGTMGEVLIFLSSNVFKKEIVNYSLDYLVSLQFLSLESSTRQLLNFFFRGLILQGRTKS